ncbi:MAG TPA: DMT family transporter [Burkholderiaceae bacterium]|nr:DMT family transporter [Burkholderiaceae bacterium]
MRARDLSDLLLLAALWGASFLFMRVAVPQFGPVPLMGLRTGIGAAVLLPFLFSGGRAGDLIEYAPRIAVVGLINSALPFVLFAYATLHLSAGFAAVLNATAPFWTAIVALAWFGERLGTWRMLGLLVGFAGVLVLVWGRLSFAVGGAGLPIVAALMATLCYGLAANYTRRYMQPVGALASAAGSQLAAFLILLPFMVAGWPSMAPDAAAWGCALLLGMLSTGLAYVLFFRLIARIGPSRAITVTFLIPVFGMFWGALFLGEQVGAKMLVGAATILAGTALTTGLVGPRRRP